MLLRNLIALVLVTGLSVAIAFVVWGRWDEVAVALAVGGQAAILLIPWFLVPIFTGALSWRLLFPTGERPTIGQLAVGIWVGVSVNWLLPVAQIGGEIAKARLLIRRGWPMAATTASVVADQTLQATSQILYSIVGFALLAALTGTAGLMNFGVVSVLLLALGIYLFYRIQKAGPYRFVAPVLLKIAPALSRNGFANAAETLDQSIGAVYRRHGAVLGALALRMIYRFASAAEVWITFHIMGQPISFAEAVVIESLTQTARTAAFVVPAGVGIQEAALILTAGALGYGPDLALGVAAAKRFRELGVGLPGLITFQISESKSLWTIFFGSKPDLAEQTATGNRGEPGS